MSIQQNVVDKGRAAAQKTSLPEEMHAARFHGGEDLRIDTVPAPRPEDLGPREVLVEVHACGVCGTDLHEYFHGPLYSATERHPITGAEPPITLGHEFAGRIVAVGAEVAGMDAGTRVAVMPQIFCGECRQCRAGREQTCERLAAVGYTARWGGLADYAVLRDDQVFALPDGMTYEDGALVEPTAVAVHAVRSAPVRAGDSVLITGGGPIGQLVALAAAALGAGVVVISEPNEKRRARAAALGVARTVDPLDAGFPAQIADVVDDGGFDVCIEASGSQPALQACFDHVVLGGTIVQTAMATKPMSIHTSRQLTMRDVTYKGVYCYPVRSWPEVIELIASGSIPARRIVTSTVDLEDTAQAFHALADPDGDDVKILVSLRSEASR